MVKRTRNKKRRRRKTRKKRGKGPHHRKTAEEFVGKILHKYKPKTKAAKPKTKAAPSRKKKTHTAKKANRPPPPAPKRDYVSERQEILDWMYGILDGPDNEDDEYDFHTDLDPR
jgi:hypothetical protein